MAAGFICSQVPDNCRALELSDSILCLYSLTVCLYSLTVYTVRKLQEVVYSNTVADQGLQIGPSWLL